MEQIKKRLKEALQIRNITAADLARRSGMNKGSISKYLKGEVIPKQSAIGSLANALHVSPAWLMGYDVPMEPSNEKETMPAGTYRGGPGIKVLPNLWLDFESLTDKNKEQVASYIQFLKKMQEEGGEQ